MTLLHNHCWHNQSDYSQAVMPTLRKRCQPASPVVFIRTITKKILHGRACSSVWPSTSCILQAAPARSAASPSFPAATSRFSCWRRSPGRQRGPLPGPQCSSGCRTFRRQPAEAHDKSVLWMQRVMLPVVSCQRRTDGSRTSCRFSMPHAFQ